MAIKVGGTTVIDDSRAANVVSITGLTTALSAAQGGTGLTAAGTSGNVLLSNGTIWTSTAPASGLPVGAEMLWPTETVPDGWLEENGASLNRSGTYAALFAIIGTTYGTASGGTFNLPDSRGRFPRIWDHAAGKDPNAGSRAVPAVAGATMTAGDHVGTNQAEDLLSHTHLVTGAVASPGGGSGGFPQTTRNDSNIYTGAYGGSETRPINTYRMMIIKY